MPEATTGPSANWLLRQSAPLHSDGTVACMATFNTTWHQIRPGHIGNIRAYHNNKWVFDVRVMPEHSVTAVDKAQQHVHDCAAIVGYDTTATLHLFLATAADIGLNTHGFGIRQGGRVPYIVVVG